MLSGYQKYILDLLISMGKVKEAAGMLQDLGVNSPAIAEAKDFKKTIHDLDEENKSELDQAVDKANEKFAERLEKIAAGREFLIAKYKSEIIGDSTVPRTPAQLQQDQISAAVSAAMDIDAQNKMAATARDAEIKKANLKDQTEAQQILNEAVQQELEIDKFIADLDKQIAADKQKQAQLQQEIARSQTQAQLKAIRDNPFLNNYEKGQASIAPLQTQISQNDRAMSNLADTANQPGTDATAKFEAMQKINQLMSEQVDLQHQLSEAENADSFSYQLGQTIVRLQNVGTMAQQAAQAFGAVWTTAVNSISSSISGLIMGTQSWGQALRSIYNSITTEFVNQIVHMAVQWIMQHTIMAAFSSLFHVGEAAKAAASQATIVTITGTGAAQRIVIRTGEAAHDAAMTGVQVGTHAAGEGTKTGSTLLGAMARGVIRLGETIFHGLQVMIRVAAHFVGEMMMTAIAAVGMAARIPMILAETMAYVIMAAVEALAAIAAIPYVGPFLAPAIAAGILAAGIGLMTGGFAEGGYTGDGGKHDVAGIVHAGEYVMPASAVDRIGVENLAALHHGSTSATSPAASGGSGKAVSVYAFTDPRQMADHLQKNDSHEKWVVDVMSRNMHKFR